MKIVSKFISNEPNDLLLAKLDKKISDFQSFKIFTHKNPDGDGIGSALALSRILASKGKKAEIFVFDSADERFSFFPDFEKIKIVKEIEPVGNALIIYVDCSSPLRTGFSEKYFKEKEAVFIDHHLDKCQNDSSAIKIIDPSASSTAEIIFDVAKQLSWPIDRETSICLLGGVVSDTGTFQHSNTSPKSLMTASLLVKNGVNLKKIAEKLLKKRKASGSLKVWGKILSRASVDPQSKMAFSCISHDDLKKYNSSEDELAGLINLLSGIPESRFSLLLTENGFGKIKGSMRSELYKGVDVAKIARAFGGGGHKLAAGFEIDGKIKEKMHYIKEVIQKELAKQQNPLQI